MEVLCQRIFLLGHPMDRTTSLVYTVGWSCRIYRLHPGRGVRPPEGATCWPWVATHKVLGQNPDGRALIQ